MSLHIEFSKHLQLLNRAQPRLRLIGRVLSLHHPRMRVAERPGAYAVDMGEHFKENLSSVCSQTMSECLESKLHFEMQGRNFVTI